MKKKYIYILLIILSIILIVVGYLLSNNRNEQKNNNYDIEWNLEKNVLENDFLYLAVAKTEKTIGTEKQQIAIKFYTSGLNYVFGELYLNDKRVKESFWEIDISDDETDDNSRIKEIKSLLNKNLIGTFKVDNNEFYYVNYISSIKVLGYDGRLSLNYQDEATKKSKEKVNVKVNETNSNSYKERTEITEKIGAFTVKKNAFENGLRYLAVASTNKKVNENNIKIEYKYYLMNERTIGRSIYINDKYIETDNYLYFNKNDTNTYESMQKIVENCIVNDNSIFISNGDKEYLYLLLGNEVENKYFVDEVDLLIVDDSGNKVDYIQMFNPTDKSLTVDDNCTEYDLFKDNNYKFDNNEIYYLNNTEKLEIHKLTISNNKSDDTIIKSCNYE